MKKIQHEQKKNTQSVETSSECTASSFVNTIIGCDGVQAVLGHPPDVLAPVLGGLAGEPKDEVWGAAGESGAVDVGHGLLAELDLMGAVEGLEGLLVGALEADADAVDAAGRQHAEAVGVICGD